MATQVQHAAAAPKAKAGTRAQQVIQHAAELGAPKAAGTRAAQQAVGGQKAAQQVIQHTAELGAPKAGTRAAQQAVGGPKAGTRAAQQAAAQKAAQQAAQQAEQEELVKHYIAKIHYSDRYSDDQFEYRHVILPKQLFKMLPKEYFKPDESGTLRLLEDEEWRGIGIQQSLGWTHYEVHAPEPHVLLFRRLYEPPEPEPLKPLTRFGRK